MDKETRLTEIKSQPRFSNFLLEIPRLASLGVGGDIRERKEIANEILQILTSFLVFGIATKQKVLDSF